MAHRRMADPKLRQDQVDGKYAEHVAPINRLIDRLRNADGRGWMPHVAPMYGGVDAKVLLLLRDPGPKTHDEDGFQGSGFLCSENDDPTAERLATLLDAVGLDPRACVAWNAYPWYINRSPTAKQLEAGVGPLVELLGLLRCLQVVLLLGGHAHDVWRRLHRLHASLAARYHMIETRHTGSQAFIGTAEEKTRWRAEQLAAFQEAAAILRGQREGSTRNGSTLPSNG